MQIFLQIRAYSYFNYIACDGVSLIAELLVS